jgi:hypothetical protein
MTWKDKLEIGLKPDAPHRKDNLPDQDVRGPEIDAGDGRSPVIPAAADDKTAAPPARRQPRVRNEDEIQEDSSADVTTDDVWVPPDAEQRRGKS